MRELRGNRLAMIFQDPMTSLNPVLTVERQLTEVLETHRKLKRRGARRARSSCSSWSASRARSAGSRTSRTSSPAACGSG